MTRRLSLLVLFLAAASASAEEKFFSPEQSLARMKLPEGFRISLVAAEPTLIKPMAMTTDDRGRLWVIESHSYPKWITDGKPGKDRVLIFEEKNGKWEHTVFLDNGTNLSGIALGFGGVWFTAPPYLLFMPIKPGEDKPAGPAQVILDGWDLKARHNVVNSPTWGPDGWLYGLNGILSNSKIGAPGCKDSERVAMNCGVWRYHPTRKKFEAFAHGTTNPWGIDFDDYGECFITNCVIKHIFHVVPGGHYTRMFGQDINPHSYQLMQSCADHIHWGGGSWTSSRGGQNEHDAPGGGHAHAGCLVYLGDNFPAEYRNRVFMCNIHGNRINQDRLVRQGSGYVAKHEPDFLMANDPWFRGLALTAAADGGIFVADWHDEGECHNYEKTHPSGRIYKITYGTPKPFTDDLARKSDEELAKLQTHRNDWHVRHARRLLQERAVERAVDPKAIKQLWKKFREDADVEVQYRQILALHATNNLGPDDIKSLIQDPRPSTRALGIRLAMGQMRAISENWRTIHDVLIKGGRVPGSVQLAVAAGLQNVPLAERAQMARAIVGIFQDVEDPNIPFMVWYALEPLIAGEPKAAAAMLADSHIPLVRRNLARRLAMMEPGGLSTLVRQLSQPMSGAAQGDAIAGILEAMRGRRGVAMPEGWSALVMHFSTSAPPSVRDAAMTLSLVFGDQGVRDELRREADDDGERPEKRLRALRLLVDSQSPDLLPLLRRAVTNPLVRTEAIRGLAAYDAPDTPDLILKGYAKYPAEDKSLAIATLTSRPAYALALLDAVEKRTVPRGDITPFVARQISQLKDKNVVTKLEKVWGAIRPADKDKTKALARYTALATPEKRKEANVNLGRALFAKHCATCHKLFGEGASIGPELTGAQRANPEYVLTELLDPSAVVPREYRVVVVATAAGRTITGIVAEENDQTIALQTPTELIRMPKSEIEERRELPQSLMPEGLLAQMSDEEIRDLLAYLASPQQVALPNKR